MTIVQLEYLVAVATHRSFNKAASHCFVTQPTLSLQIQKLEDLLGVKLFDRTQQPVVPTKIGREIIEKAKLLLEDFQQIQDLAHLEKEELAGELNIGVITTLAPYLIPKLIAQFSQKHPGVKVNIWEETTSQIVSKLKQGMIDCGIVSMPILENQFSETPLFTEKMVVYAGNQSPLAHKKRIHLADIHAQDFWLLKEGHCLRDDILRICPKGNEQKSSVYEFNTGSIETLIRLVDENNGATVIPELALGSLTKEQRKKIRHFTTPEPTRQIALLSPQSFVKRRLIETLKSEIMHFYHSTLGQARKASRTLFPAL